MPTFERPNPHAYRPPASAGPRRDAQADDFAPAFRPAARPVPQPDFSALDPQAVPIAPSASSGRSDWRRWKMRSLDPRDNLPPPPPELSPEPAPPPIDFDAIEAMREGARKEGYAQGYGQGQTQGYGDGHREGYARGLEAARSEAARLQELADTFRGALARIDEEVAQTLVGLALDVARQLVRGTVAADPTMVLPAVRELIATEPALSGSPCLLLHPDDVALVETHLDGELEAAGWAVRGDAGVERGGCVASAASGELDATLATRWSRVVKALGRTDSWEPPHA